jgi:hypothetical protein
MPACGNRAPVDASTGITKREPQFNKTRGGSVFKIERPSFRVGTMMEKLHAEELRPNFRNGFGNKEIVRPYFNASKIIPRQAANFDKLQAMDLEQQGATVQLSDKTIQELFSVSIPDPTDFTWLAEEQRLIAGFRAAGLDSAQIKRELEVNKPLGREQRTTKSKRNIGEVGLSMTQQLKELEQEVKDGRAESMAQQATIIAQFALVLADTNAIAGLTRLQLTNLGEALARVGVPTNHKRLGLIPRFVDNAFYLANAGLINLLLFSKVRETPNTTQYNYDLMVLNFAADEKTGLPAIRLNSAVSGLGRSDAKRRYMDLERGGVISLGQLRSAAGGIPGGFDSPAFDIQQAFR